MYLHDFNNHFLFILQNMFRLFFMSYRILLCSCGFSKLPKTQYAQYTTKTSINTTGGTLGIGITNPVKAPIRAYRQAGNAKINERLQQSNSFLIAQLSDTLLTLKGCFNRITSTEHYYQTCGSGCPNKRRII